MKVIIVGGVAGGASCAARLRRLDEKAEIVMVEKGPYVSYTNCGLPYHVGGVLEKELISMERFISLMYIQVPQELATAIDGFLPSRNKGTVFNGNMPEVE